MPGKQILQEQFYINASVLIERTFDKSRSVCRLLGAKEPCYLMVDLPIDESQPLLLTANEKCIVRFMSDGNVFGFRARIAKILYEPFAMAILEYPNEYESITVRKRNRVECNVPASLFQPEDPGAPGVSVESRNPGEAGWQATIVDLSEGGFRLALPILEQGMPAAEAVAQHPRILPSTVRSYQQEYLERTFRRDGLFHLSFELPEPAKSSYSGIPAAITWARRHARHLFLGFKFVDPQESMVSSIQTIILHQETFFISRLPKPVE